MGRFSVATVIAPESAVQWCVRRGDEQWSVASGRGSVFPSQLRSSFGGIGKGALACYGQLPYPSKIKNE